MKNYTNLLKYFLVVLVLGATVIVQTSCGSEKDNDPDKDGVFGAADKCPKLWGYKKNNGCPAKPSDIDFDGDGVINTEDQCIDVPGVASNNGCPDIACDDDGDNDGDGVKNCYDRCPDEAGENGRSCPIDDDIDGDGIKNDDDQCPQTPGSRSNNGCPDNTDDDDPDGDGIKNDDDQCPQIPGPRSNNGCPDNTDDDDPDGDGIKNDDDQCPQTPGPRSNNGCPLEDDPKPPTPDCPAFSFSLPKTIIPSLTEFTPAVSQSDGLNIEWNYGGVKSSKGSHIFRKLGKTTVSAIGTNNQKCNIKTPTQSVMVVLSKAHLAEELGKLKNFIKLASIARGENQQDAIDSREEKKDEIMEKLFRGSGNISVDIKNGADNKRSINGYPKRFEGFYKEFLITPNVYTGVVSLEVLETTTGQAKKIILYK